jgi:prepilin-type N-terminal cleavage/methylation domain-containing protein
MKHEYQTGNRGGSAARRGRRGRAGLTLIELLVAILILSFSTAAMVTLWSISRKITEHARDTAEYYAIARQEMEKMRTSSVINSNAYYDPFRPRFFNSAYSGNPQIGVSSATTTNYNQDGATPTVSKPAVYQAVSTFDRQPTGSEDAERQLGIQVIKIYVLPRVAGDTPVYTTTMLYTVGGI